MQASEEISPIEFGMKGNVLRPGNVQHHLFRQVGLGNKLFVYDSVIRLDNEPASGILALVVARAEDERELVKFLLHPEITPGILGIQLHACFETESGIEGFSIDIH